MAVSDEDLAKARQVVEDKRNALVAARAAREERESAVVNDGAYAALEAEAAALDIELEAEKVAAEKWEVNGGKPSVAPDPEPEKASAPQRPTPVVTTPPAPASAEQKVN